jgi:hypothetical protein
MGKIKFPVKIDPRRPALVVDANGEAVSAPHDDFDEKFNGDFERAAQALADALNAGNCWQPIESAPIGVCKDVLLLFLDGRQRVGHQGRPDGLWGYSGTSLTTTKFDPPTHWMPLPAPPEPEQPDDDEAVALLREVYEVAALSDKLDRLADENERLRAILGKCHNVLGADERSDHDILPESITKWISDRDDKIKYLEAIVRGAE